MQYMRIARLLDNTVFVGPSALIWQPKKKKLRKKKLTFYQAKLYRQMCVWHSLSQARGPVVPQGLQISKPVSLQGSITSETGEFPEAGL